MSSLEETEKLNAIQEELDNKFPSPEEDLINLSKTLALTPRTKRYAEARILVCEIDDLIAQNRWHIGKALILLEQYPQIAEIEKSEDPMYQTTGMPASAQLLLRSYVSNPERVLFTDLSESWRGGTVAGWVFHMMIDNAVVRSISILDRLARIICLVADVSFDKVYFRSRKLAKVHEKLRMEETQRLVDQSSSPVYELLLNYRDGWSHDRKAYARLAGFAPTETYSDDSGEQVRIEGEQWTAEYLRALANAAYSMVREALHDVYIICDQKAERDSSNPLVR